MQLPGLVWRPREIDIGLSGIDGPFERGPPNTLEGGSAHAQGRIKFFPATLKTCEACTTIFRCQIEEEALSNSTANGLSRLYCIAQQAEGGGGGKPFSIGRIFFWERESKCVVVIVILLAPSLTADRRRPSLCCQGMRRMGEEKKKSRALSLSSSSSHSHARASSFARGLVLCPQVIVAHNM